MEENQIELISVIVPIYKVEEYLEKCINSIINQTYGNLEIILVDDGSPDNCGEICDKYEKQDKRIKVIHKNNGGLSDARNKGIEKATGNYIAFIDSDDYIDSDYIEYLYTNIKKGNYDISMCNPKLVYKNKYKTINKIIKEQINEIDSEKALEFVLYQKKINHSAWGKLYKRELFIQNKIRYPLGKIYEDMGTTYKLIMASRKIVYSNLEKYNYLLRNDSIIGTCFKKSEFDIIEMLDKLEKDVLKVYPNLYKATRCRRINAYFYLLRKMNKKDYKIYKEQYIYLKKYIKKHRFIVLLDKKSRLKTKIGIVVSYFGFDITKKIQEKFKNFSIVKQMQ